MLVPAIDHVRPTFDPLILFHPSPAIQLISPLLLISCAMSDIVCAVSTSFLPFEQPCGGRGCTHVFNSLGPDPFEALSAQVKAHRPHCVGRNFGATHRCDTGWRPPMSLLQQWQQPTSSATASDRSGAVRATPINEMSWEPLPDTSRASSQETSDDDQAMPDGGSDICVTGSIVDTAAECHTRDPAPGLRCPRKPSPSCKQSSSKSHIKKTAKKESERRAELEADHWAFAVEPNNVLCRGCHRDIVLDKRSRYFPGLWIKHRERCAGIKFARKQLENTLKQGRDVSERESTQELKTSIISGRCRLKAGG